MDVENMIVESFQFIFRALNRELVMQMPKVVVSLIPLTVISMIFYAALYAWTSFKEMWDLDLVEAHEPDGHRVTNGIADELDLEALADLLRAEFFNAEQADEIGVRNPDIYEQQEIEGFQTFDESEISGQLSMYGRYQISETYREEGGDDENDGQLQFLE